jgi:hypothetical protein
VGIVYHYANTQAFKGVVENAEVWATDFRYLNDSRELVYTWPAFVERLEQLAEQPSDHSQAYRAQLEALRLLDARDLMRFDDAMFVSCFSELPDAVSQWTRYGGGDGRGFALGFDAERIRSLKVPQYNHAPGGKLAPVMATVGGGPTSGQQVELTWGAFLQKVGYGDDARDLVVDGLIDTVQRIGETSGTFENNVGNCIFQTHGLVHRLPLVKHSDYQDECEHRITITEHHGGHSLNQMRALHSLGEPFSFYAQGALTTVDVQFRPDESKIFTPYVRLPFDREALVKVVIGPIVKHHLAETTVRRFLDRYGFRDTEIEISQAPLQV